MLKAMLIDDEYFFRQYLMQAVQWEALGFELVAQARNGIDGLELIKNLLPDVALIDINMPGMDGLTMCEQLHKDKIATKVILITGYAEFSYAQQALRLGVHNYIAKPVDLEELTAELAQIHRAILQEDLQKDVMFILKNSNLYGKRILKGDILNELMSPNADRISHRYPLTLRQQVLKHMRADEMAQIANIIDDLFLRFEEDRDDRQMMRIVCFEVYSTALAFSMEIDQQINLSRYDVQTIMQGIHRQTSIPELKRHLIAEITQIAQSAHGALSVDHQIDRIKKYIQAHYANPRLNIDDIAKRFYLSYHYLCNYFKKTAGITINEYITDVRLTNAMAMFQQGNHQIALVAGQVGYEDANYFGKVFKKKFGVTPSTYIQSLSPQAGAQETS